jgi:hypothetical protein
MSGSESQTSKQTSIPQEIIDQFIDHLYNDWEALKTCALVCRAWVPSSRYHLFGHVNIRVSECARFSDLIGHLDHPLCTFAPSVRRLFIFADDEHPTPIDLRPGWVDPLIPYLTKLTSVKTLVAYKIGGRTFGWEALFKSAPFVAQITRLTLLDPKFMTFEDCTDTIHSFPSLESLGYCHPYYSDQGTLPSIPAFQGSPPPSLRTLNTVSFSPTTQLIWQWFHRSQTRLSAINLGGLLSISAWDVSAAKLSSFAQYLQFLGPSLEVLRGDFGAAPTICKFLVDRAFE